MSQTFSLIVPVFNEAVHLERFLKIIDDLSVNIDKELVIINDGSTDGSAEILKAFRFKSKVVLIEHVQNLGKGAAIRTGIQAATGSFIGIQDADFETDPHDIPALLHPLLNGDADVVFGSRFTNSQSSSGVIWILSWLANKGLTALSNALSGLALTDMETCYKFFRAEIIKNIALESNRFGFEPEVTAKIARLRIRLTEIPISYSPRTGREGKKMKWRDGIAAVKHIVYFNLVRTNPADCFHQTAGAVLAHQDPDKVVDANEF
jgi:glycosyltransferase involved in cell wall biosynthesis